MFVSYNRLDLLKTAVFSYRETVTLPYSWVIIDNASDDETKRWIKNSGIPSLLLDKNYYPGYATNRGFELAPPEATLLQRSDNDVEYLPGWCDELLEALAPHVGQVGLRTAGEERNAGNVGGNAIVRREVWEAGARYDERPWSEVAFEDGWMSMAVVRRGFSVARVKQPCIIHTGIASSTDPYYQQTFYDRGITFAEWGVE